jgi:hypothetical protein
LVDHHPIEIISSIKNKNNNNKEFRLYQIEKKLSVGRKIKWSTLFAPDDKPKKVK